MFRISSDYNNVCSKPSTHKTKLKENKMDTLNQGKEDKNKDIIENNNKNNSGNRNTKSAQFKVAFITQAAVIAALIGAIGTYALRKNKWLAPLPPIIANTLIVPFVLKYAYGSEGIFAMFFVTIGASEFIVCGVIGMILLFALNPVRNVIFKGVE